MATQLNVPLVAQINYEKSWYAAACMVNSYYRPGARFWAPDVEGPGVGVLQALHFGLLTEMGLTPINYAGKWEAKYIETVLNTRGPMVCIGYWSGLLSAIVVTGIDKDRIFYNDSVEPAVKADKVAWFNQYLIDYCHNVMVKDPSSL